MAMSVNNECNIKEHRVFFHNDNYEILKCIESNSVHLIFTDPPFNVGRTLKSPKGGDGEVESWEDKWRWNQFHDDWLDARVEDGEFEALVHLIQSALKQGDSNGAAFMVMLAPRLVEMRRVLRWDGNLLLWCDHHAAHYIRIMLNDIFGLSNFMVEYVLHVPRGSNSTHRVKRATQSIFHYAKAAGENTFNFPRMAYLDYKRKEFKQKDDIGGWFNWKDGEKEYWLDGQEADNTISMYRAYLYGLNKNDLDRFRKDRTVPMDNWLSFMHNPYLPKEHSLTAFPKQKGYPTQKPIGVPRYLIQSFASKGHIMLDPFCGGGPFLAAAEAEGLRWIGIDESKHSHARMQRQFREAGYCINNQPPLSGMGLINVKISNYRPTGRKKHDEDDFALPILSFEDHDVGPNWKKLNKLQQFNFLGRVQTCPEGLIVCAGCGLKLAQIGLFDRDHIKSRKGRWDPGSDDLDNCILLCRPCNQRKKHKLSLEQLHDYNEKHPPRGSDINLAMQVTQRVFDAVKGFKIDSQVQSHYLREIESGNEWRRVMKSPWDRDRKQTQILHPNPWLLT